MAEHGGNFLHASRDPPVYLVEDREAFIHGIADRACLDRFRIEVAQHDHVTRRAPVAFAYAATLQRIHHDNEIRGADWTGPEQTRAVGGEIHASPRCGYDRLGWRGAVESDEPTGLHVDPDRRELTMKQRRSERTAADVPVTHHQQGRGSASRAQRLQRFAASQWM